MSSLVGSRILEYVLFGLSALVFAINAFRRAAQYDPSDRSLDAAIDKSQKGIVLDFLNRYKR